MTFLDQLKSWDACDEGYGWAEANNIQSCEEAWDKLQRPDWMRWLADRDGVKLDETALRLFACACAEEVLPIYEKAHPGDLRPRHAIETARRFANGKATLAELHAAEDAARSAAYAAAWSAAYAAAWSAARAAEDAARSASRAAAWAAEAADWSADWAARAAAMAARARHADLLRAMLGNPWRKP